VLRTSLYDSVAGVILIQFCVNESAFRKQTMRCHFASCVLGLRLARLLKGLSLLIEALSNILEVVEQKQFLLVNLLENVAYLFLDLLHINLLFLYCYLELIRANLKHHVGVQYFQMLHLNGLLVACQHL